MSDLRDTRRKLKIAFAVLAVVDVAAGALLLSPVIGSEQSRRQQMDQLWKELQTKTKQVEPLKNIDKKIVLAHDQIDDFYKNRLVSEDSAVSEELGTLASQSGVKIGAVKYSLEDPDAVGLQPIKVDADLSGDYLQLVRFINAVERDKLFFLIDSVQLGGEQEGQVKLGIKLETYLKTS